MAPSMALITDFSMTAPGTGSPAFSFSGGGVTGGVVAYGMGAPTIAVVAGTMNMKMSTPASNFPQYVGAVIFFNGCVDASAYKGVRFKLGGTISGCTMQYATTDSEHASSTSTNLGSCTAASCYPPQKPLDVLPAVPTDMTVLWGDATLTGSPATAVDPARLTSLQWQFTIPMGMGTCSANVTIDEVTFVQ